MNERAAILHLAKKLARQNALSRRANQTLDLAREIETRNLRVIPAPLWRELDALRNENPTLALSLARVLDAVVQHTRNTRLRPIADLALIRALNVCGEFYQALARCPDAARLFEKRGDRENVARVWLEAAWAETWLGDLQAAEAFLAQAAVEDAETKNPELELKRAWIRARMLRQQGAFQQALEHFQQIYSQLRDAGDMLNAARALREIGHTRARVNPADGAPSLTDARQVFIETNSWLDAALNDFLLAQILIDQSQFQEAEQLLTATQTRFAQQALRFFVTLCDFELGFLHSEQDRLHEAIQAYTRARAGFVELGAAQEVLSCEINIGWQLLRLNHFAEALTRFENAAQVALETGQQTRAGLCFLNMGVALAKQERYASALTQYQRARAIFAREKMVERLIEVDLNLGQVYFQLGDYAQALSALNAAHASSRQADIPTRLAVCELYRARVWLAQGKKARARDALDKARALFIKHKQTLQAALCDRELALLETRPDAALARVRRSRQHFVSNGMQIDAALCDVTRAELALRARAWHDAERYLFKAQKILQYGFPDHYARVLYGLARMSQALGQPQRALENYVQAAQLLGQLRGGLELETLSNSFFGARLRVIREGLKCARQQQAPEHALALVEASKAQTFLHLLDAPETRLAEGDAHLRALQEREQALYYRLVQARQQLIAQVHIQTSATLRGQTADDARQAQLRAFRALTQEYETLAQQLRLAHRNLAGTSQLDPFSLEEFRAAAQQRWGAQWLTLNYYFDRQWLYILCIDSSRVTLLREDWTWRDQQMLEQCTDLRYDMRALVYGGILHGQAISQQENPLAYLGAKLLPLQVRDMSKASTLLISPHGLLHQLAFGALEIDGEFLAARATVQTIPNLQSFTQLCRNMPRGSADTLLVCGARDFGERAAELFHAHREVNQIRRVNPSATVLWQARATRAKFQTLNETKQLREFSILHFATHALVELSAPHLSHILLGEGELGVMDISNLSLEARLVTLSACSSNVGKGGKGDEWVSLARAFFHAGARGIVASLWAVHDESTAYLMQQFYRQLRQGAPIAVALQRAQLHLAQEGYSALHWAPFVFIGADE